MPIWGQLELLCRAISEEGQKEAEKILSLARADAERVIVDAKERAERDFQEKILSERAKAHAEAKRLVDSAELEARRRLMSFHEEVIREVLDSLDERFRRFRSQPDYVDFLLYTWKEGIEHLPGKEFLVELNLEDQKLIEEKMGELARERSIKMEIMPSSSFEGGIRIYTADRRLLYDNSLSARLKRIENDIRQHIWREIFGTER